MRIFFNFKKMKNKLLTFALMLALVVPSAAYAAVEVETTSMMGGQPVINEELKAELDALKTLRDELKTQIDAGEITLEEARTKWQEAMQAVREKKQEYFSERLEQAKERYEKINENNPELAEQIRERFETMKQQREEEMTKRKELIDSLKAGEIEQDQFRDQLKTLRSERLENIKDRVEQWRVVRMKQVEARKEIRQNNVGRFAPLCDEADEECENQRPERPVMQQSQRQPVPMMKCAEDDEDCAVQERQRIRQVQ